MNKLKTIRKMNKIRQIKLAKMIKKHSKKIRKGDPHIFSGSPFL